jgi:hypothetical protein
MKMNNARDMQLGSYCNANVRFRTFQTIETTIRRNQQNQEKPGEIRENKQGCLIRITNEN